MKASIHPDWNHTAKVTCSCGNTFTTGSSKATIDVDVCSACHPFYTGEMKFIDRQGRVERFSQKRAAAASYVKSDKKKDRTEKETLSLRQMLEVEKKNLAKAEQGAKSDSAKTESAKPEAVQTVPSTKN